MFRLIVLLLLFNKIGFTQNPVVKLTYEQVVTKHSTGEIITNPDAGIFNSFQPILLSYSESISNLKKIVFVEKNNIYVENYLLDRDGLFSSKIEKKDKIYYLNSLTGEEKLLDHRNFAFTGKEIPTKFKLKKQSSQTLQQLEIYKAENKDMLIEYHVNPQLKRKMNSDLSEEFLYKNRIIVKSVKYIKEENKQIVNELISIDTIEDKSLKELINIDSKRKSYLANLSIASDSIEYNEEIPDIYVNQIGNDITISLNKYKDNGKYLMVDFWGTWCKPCLASIPKLKLFYKEYSDQIDLLALNYNDPNEVRVKEKIEQYEMDWDHGSVSEKVLKVLNPKVHFPGILLFDDKMRLIVRDKSETALTKVRSILNK